MLTPIRLVTVVLVSLLMALPARAATTIFASSVYSQSGVVNATSALGGANGAAAQIGEGVVIANAPAPTICTKFNITHNHFLVFIRLLV